MNVFATNPDKLNRMPLDFSRISAMRKLIATFLKKSSKNRRGVTDENQFVVVVLKLPNCER